MKRNPRTSHGQKALLRWAIGLGAFVAMAGLIIFVLMASFIMGTPDPFDALGGDVDGHRVGIVNSNMTHVAEGQDMNRVFELLGEPSYWGHLQKVENGWELNTSWMTTGRQHYIPGKGDSGYRILIRSPFAWLYRLPDRDFAVVFGSNGVQSTVADTSIPCYDP